MDLMRRSKKYQGIFPEKAIELSESLGLLSDTLIPGRILKNISYFSLIRKSMKQWFRTIN